ncbi:hypothetical protein BKA62DRAFT_617059 [Auriculariales sp. MPI-PUGE-AT-0066]|nr:hypothetical protein BKA62DRAFT_617059 [Auriculariales sp. MPI-PUGE-AT-0066]
MDALTAVVLADMGKNVVACDVVAQDEWRKTCDVMLEDGTEVIVLVYSAAMPKSVVETEMATMSFVKANTTIPIQKVLHSSAYNSRALGPYAILEKVYGVRLDQVFETLPEFEQDLIVMHWARWTSELCSPSFRLPKIGSLVTGTDVHGTPNIGPLLHLPFFQHGRAAMPQLDRGPWASGHEYRLACAQRELECARALFTQGLELSESYRRSVEDGQLRAERAAALVTGIAEAVKDMDEKDPELACFALDLHELGLRNILVDAYDPTRVLAVTDWHRVTSRPLWRCAQIPRWIANSSLSAATKNVDRARLENVFRAMLRADKCPLMRALEPTAAAAAAADGSDARLALDDACDYDAVADGFLVLPALQSIAATLPGQEDTEGFAALLDPHTIAGRALRVNLVTKSFGAIAFTPPETTRMSQLDYARQERTTTMTTTTRPVLPVVKSAAGKLQVAPVS